MPRYNNFDRENERREIRRKYESDVFYDVWRSGRNPDEIDYDRVNDHFINGDSHEAAVAHEIIMQERAREHRLRNKMIDEGYG